MEFNNKKSKTWNKTDLASNFYRTFKYHYRMGVCSLNAGYHITRETHELRAKKLLIPMFKDILENHREK